MNLSQIILKSATELSNSCVPNADLDTKVLLKYVLTQDDVFLLSHPNNLLTNAQYQKFRRLIRRRKRGEPVAYLIGYQEFYGLDFKVNKHVLIPRPETETLVEKGLEFIKSQVHHTSRSIRAIDIGTGSGCIIISLAKNLPHFSDFRFPSLYAVDISARSLNVAKQNAKKIEVNDNIIFYRSDLLSNRRLPGQFDLIVANLPYLPATYPGLEHEPRLALDGGEDGFGLVKRLVSQLPDRLSSSGIALLEVNFDHGQKLSKLCSELSLNYRQINNINRYSGIYQISR